MNFDSFLPSPTTKDLAFKRWWRWSLIATVSLLTFMVIAHLRAQQTYNTCATTCASCEKIVTNSTAPQGALAREYSTINEQASVVRTHLDAKSKLTTLAHDLIKTIHPPITLKSATISPRECTLLFLCPQNYTVEKLTQKLAVNNPEITFQVARLEQQENVLLITVTALLSTSTMH